MADQMDFLTVARLPTREGVTLGHLLIKGDFQWWTLENEVRPLGIKITGQTAIPAGRYRVIINRSERFSAKASAQAGKPVNVFLPLLLDVPMFTGVRIHAGNYAVDTDGCILAGGGYDQRNNMLIHSRVAVDAIIAAIKAEGNQGRQVWISIYNGEESKDPGGLSGAGLVA
jgi:hypothetical protein